MGSRPKQKELVPQRIDRLRGLLRDNQVVRVDQLCRRLKVSAATVRRDLEALEQLGVVRRVHGGAVSVGDRPEEPLFDERVGVATKEKRRIAREAAKLIRPRDTIYLDAGSTLVELARLIRDRTNVTVVTSSLRAAAELASNGPELILIGGKVRRLSQATVGPLTRFMLEELRIDRAFMGTPSMTLEEGLTTTDPEESYTKELVMRRAGEVVLLADSGKVGEVAFAKVSGLEKIDVLITDKGIDKTFVRGLRKLGPRVVCV